MKDMNRYKILPAWALMASIALLLSCGTDSTSEDTSSSDSFVDLLSNQIDEVIVPSMEDYETSMKNLEDAAEGFSNDMSEETLSDLQTAFENAYMAYQTAAVHDYFITSNLKLVSTSNLYPIEVETIEEFIETSSYEFNTSAQERATGFPALDYLLYESFDVLASFEADEKRVDFLLELVSFLHEKATSIVDGWSDEDLREAFITSKGTGGSSAISTQLNESLVYYEDHVRENKVGIPIGLVGPNDSPIDADGTKIEGYYKSIDAENESFSLTLVRKAVEEMEDIYLGSTAAGDNGQGYDDLLLAAEQTSLDAAIKAQYTTIYGILDTRSSISGDSELYDAIQELVTLYKSDMLPILNIQDDDNLNDGD